MKSLHLCAFAIASIALAAACSEVDSHEDCKDICGHQQTCFDETLDFDTCRNSCTALADSNDQIRENANLCDSCLDSTSCNTAQAECSQWCSQFVSLTVPTGF